VAKGKSSIDYKKLLGRLNDPVQLRVFITAVMLGIGYFGICMPLSGRIDETSKKLNQERKRQRLAEDVRHLEQQVAKFELRLPEGTDSNEWVQYVLDGTREYPMKLASLDSDAPKRVGPYTAVVLRMEIEGDYRDLDSFLCWLEGNERLFRVDSARIAPARHSLDTLVMQLTLLGLKD